MKMSRTLASIHTADGKIPNDRDILPIHSSEFILENEKRCRVGGGYAALACREEDKKVGLQCGMNIR